MPAIEDDTAKRSVNQSTTESVLRRRRLVSVVELARIYGALGVKELADAIGRDKTRIIPPTGNPKLDMIDSLAGLLEWTIADVVEVLGSAPSSRNEVIETRSLGRRRNFESLRRISNRLEDDGRTDSSRIISMAMVRHARGGHERSIAHQMIGRSLMRSGDVNGALASFRTGLNQRGVRFDTELRLKAGLCQAHLALDHHVEARSVATSILSSIEDDHGIDAQCLLNAERTARYVRGNAIRESIDFGVDHIALAAAREDLVRSLQITTTDAGTALDEDTVAVGATLEIDTELGTITPPNALRRIQEMIDDAHARLLKGALSDGARLAWSWWCLFGARITLRHDGSGAHWKKVHELASKAVEFSSTCRENRLRARAYQLSFRAWEGSRAPGHRAISWHMNPKDLVLFVKTMGAKIGFMEQGWVILQETGTLERAKGMDPRSWRKGFARA